MLSSRYRVVPLQHAGWNNEWGSIKTNESEFKLDIGVVEVLSDNAIFTTTKVII